MNTELKERIESAIVDPHTIAEEIGEAPCGIGHLRYVEAEFVESLAEELNGKLEEAVKARDHNLACVERLVLERDSLRRWKAEASKVLEELDLQKLGELLEIPLGQSVSESLLPAVSDLLARRVKAAELTAILTAELKSALEECNQLRALAAESDRISSQQISSIAAERDELRHKLRASEAGSARMREALLPFAKMNREESDLPDDHFVVSRGVASDLTMLVERDFRNAAAAIKSVDQSAAAES